MREVLLYRMPIHIESGTMGLQRLMPRYVVFQMTPTSHDGCLLVSPSHCSDFHAGQACCAACLPGQASTGLIITDNRIRHLNIWP